MDLHHTRKRTAKIAFPACAAYMLAALLWGGLPARAGPYSGTKQSGRLYTEPSPSAGGGIEGRVDARGGELIGAFAVNALHPSKVYRAELSADREGFRITGLPVGKYDLLLLCETRFYEGMTLTRDEGELSEEDREQIEQTIMKSIPFFDTKEIHRMAGAGGKARCVLQEVRTDPTLNQKFIKLPEGVQPRSIKLAFLQDVGVGWQLVDTREIVRSETSPHGRKGILPHAFQEELHNIRIVDNIKDLGILRLK